MMKSRQVILLQCISRRDVVISVIRVGEADKKSAIQHERECKYFNV